MAYVELRRNGQLVICRPVEEEQARRGCKIRLKDGRMAVLAVGESTVLGPYEIRVSAGDPPKAAPGAASSTRDLPERRHEVPPEPFPQVDGYEVVGRLGEGGMGIVWRAVQLSTKRLVALKFLAGQIHGSPTARARFQREVELGARLDHPNIARVYDSGLNRGGYFYAMELVQGLPLDQYVRAQQMDPQAFLGLMRRVCQAVHHAHRHGVVHRDLKPSNILVTVDGEPRVLDFGLAKALLEPEDAVAISIEGEVAGTPAYMSPEQAAGSIEEIDERSDVYSLGVILFRLLLDAYPHDLSGARHEVLRRIAVQPARRPRELRKRIDVELESILLKALAMDKDERYRDAGELDEDLERYLSDEPVMARQATPAYRLARRIRKHRVKVTIALGAAVAVSVAAVFVGRWARQQWSNVAQEHDNVAQAYVDLAEKRAGIATAMDARASAEAAARAALAADAERASRPLWSQAESLFGLAQKSLDAGDEASAAKAWAEARAAYAEAKADADRKAAARQERFIRLHDAGVAAWGRQDYAAAAASLEAALKEKADRETQDLLGQVRSVQARQEAEQAELRRREDDFAQRLAKARQALVSVPAASQDLTDAQSTELTQARAAVQSALGIKPDHAEALAVLAAIESRLRPRQPSKPSAKPAAALSSADKPPASPGPPGTSDSGRTAAKSPGASRPFLPPERALQQTVAEADFDQIEFAQVVEYLRNAYRVNLSVDWAALSGVGIKRTAPVTLHLRNVRLEKVLTLLLERAGSGAGLLGFEMEQDVVTISVQEALDRKMVVQTYDVRDLIAQGLARSRSRLSSEKVTQELVSTIQETVAPESWQATGGMGGIRPVGSTLVVNQSRRVHRQMADLLRSLRGQGGTR